MRALSSDLLRVGIVSGILHPRYGGPVSVIEAHAKGLSPFARVEIFGTARPEEMKVVESLFPNAHIFPRSFPNRWFMTKGLRKALFKFAEDLDVIHAHMLWDYPVLISWLAARQARKPLVITLHGSVLEPWRYRSFYKKVYRLVIIKRLLRDTDCIHAVTSAEAAACHRFGINCPVRVIPNGLFDHDFDLNYDPKQAYNAWPQLRNYRIMLYLGRLWVEKGLDLLINSWAKVLEICDNKEWLLVLAGPDYRNYETVMQKLIDTLGIRKHVLITGLVEGHLKNSLLGASHCFVLPSFSEGFSMSILEAMAASLPVLYTRNCNFPELAKNGGGWEISLEEKSLVDSLINIINTYPSVLTNIGKKANKLGRQSYTLSKVTTKLLELYNDVILIHS